MPVLQLQLHLSPCAPRKESRCGLLELGSRPATRAGPGAQKPGKRALHSQRPMNSGSGVGRWGAGGVPNAGGGSRPLVHAGGAPGFGRGTESCLSSAQWSGCRCAARLRQRPHGGLGSAAAPCNARDQQRILDPGRRAGVCVLACRCVLRQQTASGPRIRRTARGRCASWSRRRANAWCQ